MTERMVVELTTGTRIIFEGAEQISSFDNALEHAASTGALCMIPVKQSTGDEVEIFTNHIVMVTREKESAEC